VSFSIHVACVATRLHRLHEKPLLPKGAEPGLLAGLVILITLAPQLRAEHRFTFVPSVQVSAVQDDNLNYSIEDPLSDRIERVAPQLMFGIDSARILARGTVGLDAERYATHSQLDNSHARARAGVMLQYRATPRLTMSVDGAYLDTNTAAELNTGTGLAAPRVRAQRTSFGAAASMRFSDRVTAEASGSMMTTNVSDGIAMRSNEQAFSIVRRISSRNSVRLQLSRDHLIFEGETTDVIDSPRALAGFSHDFSDAASWSVLAGPRIIDGHADLDFTATIARGGRTTAAALSLSRTIGTIVGYSGVVETRTIESKFSFAPARRFHATASPTVIFNTKDNQSSTVYRLAAGAQFSVVRGAAFDLNYQLDRQHGVIDPLHTDHRLSHATLSLGLTLGWMQ
jgi:hypothetical protein